MSMIKTLASEDFTDNLTTPIFQDTVVGPNRPLKITTSYNDDNLVCHHFTLCNHVAMTVSNNTQLATDASYVTSATLYGETDVATYALMNGDKFHMKKYYFE